MHTRTLDVNGERLVLTDTGTNAPPVVMLHGNSHHRDTFEPLIRHLPKDYRYLTVDLPGHGSSPPARHPEDCYSLPGYAGLLVGLVAQESLQEAVFVGHSLGGHILTEALPELPRARGLFIMGAPPVTSTADLGRAFHPHPAGLVIYQAEMSDAEAIAFEDMLAGLPETAAEEIRQAYHATDPAARTALGASVMANRFRDAKAVLNASGTPLAIVGTTDDAFVNPDYLHALANDQSWGDCVRVLPGLGHWPHVQDPETLSRRLAEFLDDCHGARLAG